MSIIAVACNFKMNVTMQNLLNIIICSFQHIGMERDFLVL